MKTYLQILGMLFAAFIFGIAANPAAAQPGPGGGPGYGRGPGMMGDYGGPGYGPGYGRGPGMTGEYGGQGYGPGYGRGQRGGDYGGPGYGMGPGGGFGGPGFGMGPGMMGGRGGDAGLNLTAEQKAKITPIQRDARRKMWALMGKMMESQYALQDLYDADKQDAAAINKQYKEVEDARKQMVEISVDVHNRLNDILTPEQREQSRQGRRGYGPMMRGY